MNELQTKIYDYVCGELAKDPRKKIERLDILYAIDETKIIDVYQAIHSLVQSGHLALEEFGVKVWVKRGSI